MARVCVAQAGWQVMHVRAEMRPPTRREELAVACSPVTAQKSSPRISDFLASFATSDRGGIKSCC